MSVPLRSLIPILREALALELPYTERVPNEMGKAHASVALLFANSTQQGGPALLYTKRSEALQSHQGQMAFPGGKLEPGESAADAALRETHEEVGILPQQVQLLGALPELVTVTGYRVTPFVGAIESLSLEDLVLSPSPSEIAETLWAPLSLLQAEGTYAREWIEYQRRRYPIHVYKVGGQRIWGATGAMTKNLLDRMGQVAKKG